MGNVTALRGKLEQAIPKYLSPEQVCAIVPGMTPRRLRGLRDAGLGPKYSKPTLKTVVYTEADVLAWVSAHTVTTTEQS